MTYEASAERIRRRDINLSEGKKISKIKVAEGKSFMRIARAEGSAKRIQMLNQAQSDSIKNISAAIK
jgi:regulator of protease activity HflC (stomatin/prohibitin superfamily)